MCLCALATARAEKGVDIKQFAERFIAAETAAWERGDFTALQALEHKDIAFQNIDGTVYRGFEGHRKAIEDTKASFHGAKITQQWRYLMGEGNIFTVSYVWTVHLPQTDLKIAGMAVGRLQDGKLIEEWGAGALQQPVASK